MRIERKPWEANNFPRGILRRDCREKEAHDHLRGGAIIPTVVIFATIVKGPDAVACPTDPDNEPRSENPHGHATWEKRRGKIGVQAVLDRVPA